MAKSNDTTRISAEELKARIAKGEDRTDRNKVAATTAAELTQSIAADADEGPAEPDWTKAVVGLPVPKDHINIRIDHDVLEWFRSRGRGYQTLMNNVLRAFVTTQQTRDPH